MKGDKDAFERQDYKATIERPKEANGKDSPDAAVVSLQVEITPPHGEISVGESKFFLCEVVGSVKDIDWFAPSGEKLLPNRQDISVSRNDETSSTLTIYSATVDNAGIYKCVAREGDMESEATVNVKIYQKLTIQNAPSPQEFNEGDDAEIVCDVISSPPPTIIWKYRRAPIQLEKDVRFKVLGSNHLQIRGIKKTDEGEYTCEGRNRARGEIDFRFIKVIVNVLPSIRTRYAELNATADIGHAVMLACYADGYPEPMVTWARNNVVLEADEKYSLNEDGSELTIKDVKKVDEGDYICIARNKAGEKQEEISLNVFVQPKITFLENQTASELEEQITLTCEATGDPTPSIVWSFGRRVFSEGEQASWTRPEKHKSLDGNVVVRSDARVSSLTLKYVQFTDAGQYLCTARNSIGQDIQSMYLEVRYAPKIQGSVAVYTWESNPANITCQVLAHPGASVLWFRDGQQLPGVNTTNLKIYNTVTNSYLEVTPESQSDFGSYNCTASNLMGSESKEFLLIQAEVPSAPIIEQVLPYPSTAQVEFHEPDSSGGVPILKYKAEWKVAGQEWISKEYDVHDGLSMITIVGLKPETKYEVKMSAINGKGEGDSSPPETFKTQPVNLSTCRQSCVWTLTPQWRKKWMKALCRDRLGKVPWQPAKVAWLWPQATSLSPAEACRGGMGSHAFAGSASGVGDISPSSPAGGSVGMGGDMWHRARSVTAERGRNQSDGRPQSRLTAAPTPPPSVLCPWNPTQQSPFRVRKAACVPVPGPLGRSIAMDSSSPAGPTDISDRTSSGTDVRKW
ncbi:hypothetical protein P4O66_002904 [Electrophorus voltai]|uniref:Neural cell adhesion molecule 1b n=1 Tax=Electrophorus voltai TaxID=2609070 RepID=A0AAD8YWP2_9TELE|nr:hypothetical protein P4O66_002904 [Electrophorus voltai]